MMVKDYKEWKENIMREKNPTLLNLQSLYDATEQYLRSPKSKGARKVLDISIYCIGKYLEEANE